MEEGIVDGWELTLAVLLLPHLLSLLLLCRAADSSRCRRVHSSSSIIQIKPHSHNRNLPTGPLPDKVRLHGHAGPVVEVLAGEVEVELLEGVVDALEGHGTGATPFLHRHDDLDGGAEVLEFGAGGQIREGEGEGRGGDHGEGTGGHVDGGLGRAG